MYSKSYDFKGKKFIFKLTRKAQTIIEEMQRANQRKFLKDNDLVEIMLDFENLEKEQKEIESMEDGAKKEARLREFTVKYTPILAVLSQVNINDDGVDLYKLGYILLTNYKNNPSITVEEYDEMTEEMEDSWGLEETIKFFKEMKDTVFMEMEQINKILNQQNQASVPNTPLN